MHLGRRGPVDLLRNVAHLLAREMVPCVPSTSSLDAELIVAEARRPN